MKDRALTIKFLEYLHAKDKTPPEKCIRGWCDSKRRRFMKNGQYSDLRAGEYVDPRYVYLFVEYLLDRSEPGNTQEREAAFNFLREEGVANPESLTVTQIVERVSVKLEIGDEGFAAGMMIMLSIMRLYNPWEHVRLIKSEDRVREAAAWTCIECGRHMKDDLKLPHAIALIEAQKRMGISMSAYQDWLVSMWKVNPLCVLDVLGKDDKNKPVVKAMCGALPVTESFYNRMRRGEVWSYQATPEDIVPTTSPFILVEAYGPDPDLNRTGPGLGIDLVMAMIAQQARITDVNELGTKGWPLRAISFVGTPLSGRRLEKFDYRQVGTVLPGSTIKIMERTLSYTESSLLDAPYMGIWRALQHRLRNTPIGDQRPERERPLGPLPETA